MRVVCIFVCIFLILFITTPSCSNLLFHIKTELLDQYNVTVVGYVENTQDFIQNVPPLVV